MNPKKLIWWMSIAFVFAIENGAFGQESVAVQPVDASRTERDPYRVVYSVEYARTPAREDKEAKSLLADLYLPTGEGRFPTLLMVHGGAWFSGNKAHVTMPARYAAKRGYAVVAINYRLAPAYKFPSQLEDCRTGLRWIADNAEKYSFDPERLAAYGYSAGAHLACLLGMTQNNRGEEDAQQPRVRAIVAGGAPCEFSWLPKESERLAFWLGGSRLSVPEMFRAASPTTFVDAKDPPTFFYHGEVDRIVPLTSARTMHRMLESVGVESSFHLVPEATHLGAFLNQKAREEAIAFLDGVLSEPDKSESARSSVGPGSSKPADKTPD